MGKNTKLVTGAEVREWAREQGLEVGTRGRLSQELIEQYKRAKRGRKAYVEPHELTEAE